MESIWTHHEQVFYCIKLRSTWHILESILIINVCTCLDRGKHWGGDSLNKAGCILLSGMGYIGFEIEATGFAPSRLKDCVIYRVSSQMQRPHMSDI